ncbi:MAG: DUF1993 domain-containing protein [Bdellovibrionota bacterium]
MLDQFTQFAKMLHNLSLMLDKAQKYAEAKKFEPEVLLNSRLAPDMFSLTRQVQIACDTAKLATARMTGKEAPKNEDTEKTIPELKARIESTLGFVTSMKESDFTGWETRTISHPRWEGSLTGKDYFFQHAVPNVYFHVMASYAILRHNGVDLGKKDYLGTLPFQK